VPIGTAVGDEPETEYMVTSQNGLVNGCCFNYGNAETTSNDDGNGTMEAVYFGGGVVWGTGSPGGHNNGPWVMADLENGLYAGWERGQDQAISTNTPLRFDFVTGVVIGDTADKNGGRGRFAIYGGNAQAGNLQVMYDGIRPEKPGYVPMQKQGSIILGIGGDNSGSAGGQWFEGVMASGAGTLATANQIQANIVAAGYGK
jgi:non-reducing end alpha-L-arabinofuranosidase